MRRYRLTFCDTDGSHRFGQFDDDGVALPTQAIEIEAHDAADAITMGTVNFKSEYDWSFPLLVKIEAVAPQPFAHDWKPHLGGRRCLRCNSLELRGGDGSLRYWDVNRRGSGTSDPPECVP